MAAKKKLDLAIVLPKHIVTAAQSSADPFSANMANTQIADKTRLFGLMNQNIQDLRHANNITAVLRYLSRTEGPLSTAVHNLVQTANNGYKIFAYTTGSNAFSAEGTNLANTLIAQINTLYDYSEGFSAKMSFESTIELMLREAIITNGVGCELVLKPGYLPDRLQVVPLETIRWYRDDDGISPVPKQYVWSRQGETVTEPVDLDIPTFWVQRMVGDPADLYPRSMMEAAVKLLVYFEEFLDDIRRVVRQSGHARQSVSLDVEKATKAAPRDVQTDPAKLQAWLLKIQNAVRDQLEAITPEQAVIMFNTATYDIKSPSFGNKIDYTPMLSMIAGMLATSMKTPPSVLGMRTDAGAQGIGNIETMIFLKSAKALQPPVAAVMSRALTLACRLYGVDVYVNFEFDPLDLRPEMELESFYTMKQERILELLSYGFIDDDKAAVLLGFGVRPDGAPKLSGTMFKVAKSQALPVNPGDTPAGKAMQPSKDANRSAGGKSNGKTNQ